jgi:hypothetical protein
MLPAWSARGCGPEAAASASRHVEEDACLTGDPLLSDRLAQTGQSHRWRAFDIDAFQLFESCRGLGGCLMPGHEHVTAASYKDVPDATGHPVRRGGVHQFRRIDMRKRRP